MSFVERNEDGWCEVLDDIARKVVASIARSKAKFDPMLDAEGRVVEMSLLPDRDIDKSFFAVPESHLNGILSRLGKPLQRHAMKSGDLYYQVAEVESYSGALFETHRQDTIFGFPACFTVTATDKDLQIKFGDFSVLIKEE